MKLNIQKIFRVIAPVFLVALILLGSAVPASAASIYTLDAGGYVFEDNPPTPDSAFMVNMPFTVEDDSYMSMIYRAGDPDASFKYPALYYVRTNGTEERAGYWINGEFYWVGYFYRIVTLTSAYTPENRTFFWWFYTCTTSRTEADVSDPWGDFTAGQLDSLEDKVDQNQEDIGSIEDAYGKLPLPNVNPDDYNISIWLETEYQALTNCIGVLWESPLIMNILACLGSFLLVSFLMFGGKS